MRIGWIDCARGLGIIAVVAGHVFPGKISEALFWFHIPLFFAISGYVFSPGASLAEYATKRSKQLLVPYATWLAILALPGAAKSAAHGFVKPILAIALGGAWLTGVVGIFWFVTCLFMALVCYRQIRDKKWVHLAVALMYAAAVARGMLIHNLRFPYAVDAVLIAVPFVHLGAVARSFELDRKVGWLWALSFVYVVAVAALFAGVQIPPFGIKEADYGIPIVAPLLAIGGIALTVLVAKHAGPLARFLSFAGTASILIMFLHQAIHAGASKLHLPVAMQFVCAVAIPLAAYPVLKKLRPARQLLLGDFA